MRFGNPPSSPRFLMKANFNSRSVGELRIGRPGYETSRVFIAYLGCLEVLIIGYVKARIGIKMGYSEVSREQIVLTG